MALRIGLFYGSTTCFTEIAAEKIQAQFAPGEIELFNIKDVPLSDSEQFDVIIFGLSTWDFGEIQEDWESHWSDIADLQLNGKIVALFGMGDHFINGDTNTNHVGAATCTSRTVLSKFGLVAATTLGRTNSAQLRRTPDHYGSVAYH